jgi:hypothetical protein
MGDLKFFIFSVSILSLRKNMTRALRSEIIPAQGDRFSAVRR